MEFLEVQPKAREIEFDAKDSQVMCFPHVINICVSHTADSFTDTSLANDDVDFDTNFPPGDPSQQTFEEACARDPIALCRATINAVRASGKQCDHLHKIIHDGNEKEWFTDEDDKIIKLPRLELLRDVRTRWDSLYKMIRRFCEIRPASYSF